MNILVERSGERGHANHGWLDSNFSFSFAEYHNPKRIHFGALRVVNDDRIAPSSGFGTHPHNNMEIVTIPLRGTLTHRDSMQHSSTITKGEVQVMSAGTGLMHSEYNHSQDELVELFQVWIFPRQKGLKPRYDQKQFDQAMETNNWLTVVNPDWEGGLWIHQEAWFKLGTFDTDHAHSYKMALPQNGAFVMVIEGEVEIAGEVLHTRDSISIYNTESFEIRPIQTTRMLLIDVPV